MISPILLADEVGGWHRASQVAVVKAFEWYEARLRTNNALDFDDLLSLCVALLRDEVRVSTQLPLPVAACSATG